VKVNISVAISTTNAGLLRCVVAWRKWSGLYL